MMIDDPTWIAIAIIGWLYIDEGYELIKSLFLKKILKWLKSGVYDLGVIWGPLGQTGQKARFFRGGPGVYIFEGI